MSNNHPQQIPTSVFASMGINKPKASPRIVEQGRKIEDVISKRPSPSPPHGRFAKPHPPSSSNRSPERKLHAPTLPNKGASTMSHESVEPLESLEDDLGVLFRHYDADGNGKISESEFGEVRKSAESYGRIFGNKLFEHKIFMELALMTIEKELNVNDSGNRARTPSPSGRTHEPQSAKTHASVQSDNDEPGIDFHRFHRYIQKRHQRHPKNVADWLKDTVFKLQQDHIEEKAKELACESKQSILPSRNSISWQSRMTLMTQLDDDSKSVAESMVTQSIMNAPAPEIIDRAPHHLAHLENVSIDGLATDIKTAFGEFLEYDGPVKGMYARFRNVCGLCGFKDNHLPTYKELKDKVLPHLNFKLKAIFTRYIDVRKHRPEYQEQFLEGVDVLIVGAGPVGLRSAIEVALCGGNATILEKRDDFTRPNILHLWSWIQYDLIGLGAKIVCPTFGSASAFLHIGTRDLQNILYKVCLLLGVKIHFNYTFHDIELTQTEGKVVASHKVHGKKHFSCDTIIDCGGVTKPVAEKFHVGYSAVKMADAIGMVASFENTKTREENLLSEFSWACQYNTRLFSDLEKVCRAKLENVVYYQGAVHYFICTPKRSNLLEEGVLKKIPNFDETQRDGPLDGVELDQDKVKLYMGRIAKYFGVNNDLLGNPNVFDFSSRWNAVQPCRVIGGENGQVPFLLSLAGDALLEPFWPEGLGIARGFLTAFDTIWALRNLQHSLGDAEALQKIVVQRVHTFAINKQVSSFTKGRTLLEDEVKYTIDPATRYKRHLLVEQIFNKD